MTTPSEEEEDEAMEKEISHILDEAEAIINEPSESVERKKEAQTLIRRAIEKSSSKTKRGEELRKRYVYISRIYYRRQIQELEVIKETLKRQIEEEEEEEEDSASLSQSAEELKRDLEECERTIELHKELLEKIELRKG
jgi:DNA repair exonuclease SbcCD ATPase subunit